MNFLLTWMFFTDLVYINQDEQVFQAYSLHSLLQEITIVLSFF